MVTRSQAMQELISWEKFKEKGYYIIPTAPDWEKDPAGLRLFYEDPVKNPLETPSGKLEFYSQRLAEHFPDDKERPPIPKWIEKGPSHDERLSSDRAKKYPLLLVSNHRGGEHMPRMMISPGSGKSRPAKSKGFDGYMYEPVWINPTDATKRGIKNGDIVKMFNERGIVLGGAIVWERIMPGVVYQDHGARIDMIAAGPEEYIDRGGANNLISPANGTSKNCWGMATSGFLVEVEKVTMEEMENGERNIRKPLKEITTRLPDCASMPGLKGVYNNESLCYRCVDLQWLLRLPDCLQGRTCRQRLDSHSQTPA